MRVQLRLGAADMANGNHGRGMAWRSDHLQAHDSSQTDRDERRPKCRCLVFARRERCARQSSSLRGRLRGMRCLSWATRRADEHCNLGGEMRIPSGHVSLTRTGGRPGICGRACLPVSHPHICRRPHPLWRPRPAFDLNLFSHLHSHHLSPLPFLGPYLLASNQDVNR